MGSFNQCASPKTSNKYSGWLLLKIDWFVYMYMDICVYTRTHTPRSLYLVMQYIYIYIYTQYHTHTHTHWLCFSGEALLKQNDRPRQSTEAFCRVKLPGPRELPGTEAAQTMWKLTLPGPFASALKSVSETQNAGRWGDSLRLLRTFPGNAE